ncbi:MAG: transcriptional regulator, partial [bacterium]|nr:transcriptional regulator [bacterium]
MIYRFFDFELDEEKFEIRRGEDPVLTQRKAFDFVHHLLLHRDRVVTHGELIDALWGGAARSLSAVPQCAAAARRALGDDTPHQAVIQTVRGRGYRFVAEVTESGS